MHGNNTAPPRSDRVSFYSQSSHPDVSVGTITYALDRGQSLSAEMPPSVVHVVGCVEWCVRCCAPRWPHHVFGACSRHSRKCFQCFKFSPCLPLLPHTLNSCHTPTMSFVTTRPSASAPSDGSRTITLLDSQPEEGRSGSSGEDDVGTLRLHGAPRTRERNRPRVVWREDVVDNEGAGKKSSKSEYA